MSFNEQQMENFARLLFGRLFGREIPSHLNIYKLDDGDMGSFIVAPDNDVWRVGLFKHELIFKDADRVGVDIDVYVNDNDQYYEFHFWKYNFYPLVKYPDLHEISGLPG